MPSQIASKAAHCNLQDQQRGCPDCAVQQPSLPLAIREIHILGQGEHLIESMATPRLGANKELEES
jgi:hypothetical protein